MVNNTTGSYNSAFGMGALAANTTAYNNTAVGYQALYNSNRTADTSANNTAIGYSAGVNISTGQNNVCLGYNSGTDALVNITTGSNNVVLGNTSTATLYCKTSTITTSDIRDKTNIRPITLGLDFVTTIQPIAYQFKTSREDDTPASRIYLGWSAQDVMANQGTETIVDDHDPENLKMAGMDMVAVLWKAVQDLKQIVDTQATEIAELKAKVGA